MANVIDGGSADKWCRENMGKGISIVYGRPQEKPASREPEKTSDSVPPVSDPLLKEYQEYVVRKFREQQERDAQEE